MGNEKDLEKMSDKFAIIREFEKVTQQSYLIILFCLIKDLYVLLVDLCLLIKPRQVILITQQEQPNLVNSNKFIRILLSRFVEC